ncbi:hypothetical protein Zmor_007193 [Zophobas morio]|uniref:PIN domain-containing protein n=1 Tax=Zophobas morio TaxID=2755281 RepID=A0AA38IR92_9CUCU|nr:hypothetical protein Zmor_007172 [Zophobas morio]KAJ3662873.1 hypothetical protein Zmor_007193 [Zophobas morio]
MSDNRKVLVAKRKNQRNHCPNPVQNSKCGEEFQSSRRGTKRPGLCNDPSKRNLANDRLKRLRTSLNEEVQKSSHERYKPSSCASASSTALYKANVMRKRPINEPSAQTVSMKLPKQQETGQSRVNASYSNAFVFKEEYLTQKKVFNAAVFDRKETFTTAVTTQCNEDMEWSTTDDLTSTTNDVNSTSQSRKIKNKFFIVVDTNIFLSHLQLIKNIVTMSVKGEVRPVIFIPWIVIEELDFIKEDTKKTNLKLKAQEAIKYVEKTMASKDDRMQGQTLSEVNEQKSVGKSQDNKIIACCLQVSEKYENMILLTADVNLKNKAHFNSIPVCSHTDIMMKISAFSLTKMQAMMQTMTSLCNMVIFKCAENAYGSACTKMSICHPLPKSLQECISRFTKYWFPVFQEVLMKQFKKSVDDLSVFLVKHPSISDNSSEVNELVRLCVRVCLFLKDVESCKDSVENTIRDLNTIKES